VLSGSSTPNASEKPAVDDYGRVHPRRRNRAQRRAGPVGLYLLYLLIGFIALLVIAPRLA
jgi:hypothetical protein